MEKYESAEKSGQQVELPCHLNQIVYNVAPYGKNGLYRVIPMLVQDIAPFGDKLIHKG